MDRVAVLEAARAGNATKVRTLLSNPKCPPTFFLNALAMVIKHHRVDVFVDLVKLNHNLVKKKRLEAQTLLDEALFQVAVNAQDLELTRLLLKTGANPNAGRGNIIVRTSYYDCRYVMLPILAKYGASLEFQNSKHLIHDAVMRGDGTLLKLLAI